MSNTKNTVSGKATLTFWGGVGNVTGANFMLKKDDTVILIDCGILQGVPEAGDINREPFPYKPSDANILFVTHAHMDHIGKIPKLVKDGFRGVIYSTKETKEIAVFMFEDALKVSSFNDRAVNGSANKNGGHGHNGVQNGEQNGTIQNAPHEPLYEKIHVDQALALWKEIPYDQKFECAPGLNAELLDAGHILGSAMVRISSENKGKDKNGAETSRNIVFTGDSGNSPAPIIKDTEVVTGANYLVIDSVYGDRNHEPKNERDAHFKKIVREAIERKGTLVMPTFSLDRTQVILYELNNLIEAGKIPSVPVFLDSPLGIKLTAVYKNSSQYFNQAVQDEIHEGDDIFNFPKLHTSYTSEDSQMIDKTNGPKIIIAGSGMSAGGRVMRHEITYLPDPNSTILLTGYQALGTLGRTLEGQPKEVEINGTKVAVRAKIEMISGYSAHRDSVGLLDFVEKTADTLEKVFVVMGELKASLFLTQRIRDYLDLDALYPERGKEYEIRL